MCECVGVCERVLMCVSLYSQCAPWCAVAKCCALSVVFFFFGYIDIALLGLVLHLFGRLICFVAMLVY